MFSDRVFSTGLVWMFPEEQSFWCGTMTVTHPSLVFLYSVLHRMKTVSKSIHQPNHSVHLLNQQWLNSICMQLLMRTHYLHTLFITLMRPSNGGFYQVL